MASSPLSLSLSRTIRIALTSLAYSYHMFPRNTIVVCSAIWQKAPELCTTRNAAMHNWNTELAMTYHEETKHSYDSVYRSRHFLDWANQPRPFKLYPGLEAILLQIGRASCRERVY